MERWYAIVNETKVGAFALSAFICVHLRPTRLSPASSKNPLQPNDYKPVTPNWV